MIIKVSAGQSLQGAVDEAARAMDVDAVELEAGATFEQNLVLPVKIGERIITIRSSRHAELPLTRITPDKEPLLPRILTPNVGPVLQVPTGRSHWKFDGVLFSQGSVPVDNAAGYAWSYNLIELGDSNQTSLADVPHHLDFDRCIIRTRDAQTMTQRGITLNSAHTTVKRCHFSDLKWPGTETHCLGGWNGPGPFVIEDNYLEAAGINVLFGGATPAIPNLVPSDIDVRKNFITKRLEWRGRGFSVKNFFELKNARRVVFAENECENTWPDGQVGWAVILNTFRDGGWEVVEDVQFIRNVIRNATNGVNLSGMDDRDPERRIRLRRVLIADNLIDGLGFGGTEAKAFQVLNASEDVTIDHNTVPRATHAMTMHSAPGFSHSRLKFINNLIPHGDYGIFADGGALGTDALNQRATDWQMEKNGFVAMPSWADRAKYPGNYFPVDAQSAGELLGTDGIPVGARRGMVPPPPPPLPPLPQPPIPPAPPAVFTAVITSPVAEAALSGKVTVTVTATDSTEISEVYLIVDDLVLMSNNAAPYSFELDTTKLGNGSHVLYVRAWNRAGQSVDSQRVNVTVMNVTTSPQPEPPKPDPPPPSTPCSISVPSSITIRRNSTGTIAVTLQDLTGPTEVRVSGSDGQVTVSPPVWQAGPTSTVKQFQVKTKNKKQVRVVTFTSACGTASVRVDVT